MKKYLFPLTLLLILGLAAQSCSSLLDKAPLSDLTSGNFLQQGVDAEAVLAGAYDMLQSEYYIFDLFTNGDVISDNCYAGGDNPNNFQLDQFRVTTTNGNVQRDWGYLYEGISRANAVLDNVPDLVDPTFSDTRKAQVLSEASFLRAYHYFHLVNLWGGVPLVKHVVTSTDPDIVQQPRATVDEVYAFIISDLEFAAQNLPLSFPGQAGRATKGAANALLAKVYAHQPNPDWTKVSAACDAVISSSQYELLASFDKLWDGTANNSKESIFEIQFIGSSPESNWGVQLYMPPSLSGDGWRKFNTPANDLVNAYLAEGDSVRYKSSIFWEGNLPWQDENYPGGLVPFPNKQRKPSSWSSPAHIMVLRYADVLLLKAEALNELNQTATAIGFLNQVRSRVSLPNTTASAQADMRAAVAKERRLELAFEGHRWFDLKRTGTAIEVMNALGFSYQVDANKLLWPLPQREMDANPNLVQNNGY